MEINQEILYIIGGVLYFIYTVWNNLRKKPVTLEEEEPAGQEPEDSQPQRPHRRETVSKPFDERVGRPDSREPSSFEELLQEFEKAAQRAEGKADEKVKKVRQADQEYEPVFEDSENRRAELEAERQMKETEARKALQEQSSAAERAKATEKEVRRKIDQTTIAGKKESQREVYGEEEPEQRRYTQPANERRQQILDMLKNPDNVTNTILASEILNRKHF